MHIPLIDGNWIDIFSLMCGAVYAAYKGHINIRLSKTKKYKIISKKTGVDFANGVALFPLLVLPMASISSEVMQNLFEASKATIAIAGVFGALAILEE